MVLNIICKIITQYLTFLFFCCRHRQDISSGSWFLESAIVIQWYYFCHMTQIGSTLREHLSWVLLF